MKVNMQDIFNVKHINTIRIKLKEKKNKEMLKELDVLEKMGETYLEGFEFEVPKLVKIPKENGKLRDIFIYPTKSNLVLKLYTEALNDKFTKDISDNVFSYRKGFRIYNAIESVQRDMREGIVFFKLDISNYFMEVGREDILELVDTCFEMDYLGTELVKMFNRDKYIYKDVTEFGYMGLMPGSPLSCTLSNLILKELDDIMTKTVTSYTRYSDDIIIGCDSEDSLQKAIERIIGLLQKYSLGVNPDKIEYFRDNKVEFLGLVVTPTEIDINEKKFKAIKRYIKKESKRMRRKVELGEINSKAALRVFVRNYNYKMYKSILRNDLHVGIGGFILSNISTMKTIREIDFYFINQSRFLLSGKYNKANVGKLSIEELESIGYKSMCELYKLRCMDKHIYMNEVHCIL